MTSSTTETDRRRMQRSLDNQCLIIEKMFAVQPRPLVSLKEHISLLEDLITELPSAGKKEANLMDHYRDIAVHFWQRFEKGAIQKGSTTNFFSSSTSSSPSVVVVQKRGDPSVHPPSQAARVMSIRKNWKPAPDCPILRPSDGSVAGIVGQVKSSVSSSVYRLPTIPPAKEIRAVLKQAFDRLDPIEDVYINPEPMKQLLLLVTKARAITMPYWMNAKMLGDIFGFAFAKLPRHLRRQYRKVYVGNKKWLLDLRYFIQDQLDQYAVQTQEEFNQIAQGGDAGGGQHTFGGRQDCNQDEIKMVAKYKTCFYCRMYGHIAAHCLVLKFSLCVKCLQFGHTDQRCPNRMLLVGIEHFQ